MTASGDVDDVSIEAVEVTKVVSASADVVGLVLTVFWLDTDDAGIVPAACAKVRTKNASVHETSIAVKVLEDTIANDMPERNKAIVDSLQIDGQRSRRCKRSRELDCGCPNTHICIDYLYMCKLRYGVTSVPGQRETRWAENYE